MSVKYFSKNSSHCQNLVNIVLIETELLQFSNVMSSYDRVAYFYVANRRQLCIVCNLKLDNCDTYIHITMLWPQRLCESDL